MEVSSLYFYSSFDIILNIDMFLINVLIHEFIHGRVPCLKQKVEFFDVPVVYN